MADDSSIQGMRIVNTDRGGPAIKRTVAGKTFDISRAGVYSRNSTNITVQQNVFEANSTAVLLSADKIRKFETLVSDNVFQYNDSGVIIAGKGASGSFRSKIKRNTVKNNGIGIQVYTRNYNNFNSVISDNTTTDNSVGINVDSQTDGDAFSGFQIIMPRIILVQI